MQNCFFHQGFEHHPQHSSEAKVRDFCRDPFHLNKKKKLFVTFNYINKSVYGYLGCKFYHLELDNKITGKDNVHVHNHLLPVKRTKQ